VKELSEQEKKEIALKTMFQNAKKQDDALEQDKMEGCDDSEWD
jgi:hypothetical protein